MIKNERQYKITKSQITKFEAALDELTARDGDNARLQKLEKDALRSQLDELRDEVDQFEQGVTGDPRVMRLLSMACSW